MFKNNFTTWPLKARILWMVALAIETIVAICGLVIGTKHIINDLLSFTMAILIFIALWCQISAITIRGWPQATDHKNTLQDEQE